MLLIKYAVLVLVSVGGGAVSAAGIFALITSIGIINRYAKVTHTARYVRLYEDMIIAGALIGNCFQLFEWHIALGMAGVAVFGLVSGIYVGSFAVCLAETIKAIPVLVRRTRIADGLGWLVLCIGLGKAIGGIVCYIWLYAA